MLTRRSRLWKAQELVKIGFQCRNEARGDRFRRFEGEIGPDFSEIGFGRLC